jgi:hypothetical protein
MEETMQATFTGKSTATTTLLAGSAAPRSLRPPDSGRLGRCALAATLVGGFLLTVGPGAGSAEAAAKLVCRKVVAETVTGEGRNTGAASRVKCAAGEMLTGGTCYPETRPEEDGSCQTSATGIFQQIIDHPQTTEQAFFSCLQTGGTDCPVKERTRAMGICCKVVDGDEAGEAADKKE